ncbi:MAG: zeta toxin family protein [Flavobacteriales bacterium]|nr:zeta toxin family protein [Flavobacteriales bacterium]
MSNPILLVIAGCNGSGKSSFSNVLTPEDLLPFDYDIHFLDFFNSLLDSELREKMAHNKAREFLKQSVKQAFSKKTDFCYETNFNSTPLFWPEKFKKEGYKLDMVYFCLDSITEAKRRVQIRVENGGHFVPEKEIEARFYLGYENLNKHLGYFENVHLLDSSHYSKAPRHLLSLSKGEISSLTTFPKHLEQLLPAFYSLVIKQ